MSEWTACAVCGQRHIVGRACPKCGGRGTAEAPPAAWTPSERPDAGPEQPIDLGEDVTALRVAGALFLLNAATGLVTALMLAHKHAADQTFTPAMIISMIVDVLVGISLLGGSPRLRGLAILRTVLGSLFFGGVALSVGFVPLAIATAVMAVGFLLLLVGTARGARIAVGTLACLGFMAYDLHITNEARQGRNPFSSVAYRDQTTKIDGEIHGARFRYKLRAPSPKWELLKPEFAEQNGVRADRAIVQPFLDAHIGVSGEVVPRNLRVDLDLYSRTVADLIRKSGAEVVSAEVPYAGTFSDARVLHYRRTTGPVVVEGLLGLYTLPGRAFQVDCYTSPGRFREAREDFMRALQSFEPLGG